MSVYNLNNEKIQTKSIDYILRELGSRIKDILISIRSDEDDCYEFEEYSDAELTKYLIRKFGDEDVYKKRNNKLARKMNNYLKIYTNL